MKILDLFCGAGGAAKGYASLGFELVGVDNRKMRRYPFEFIRCDALQFLTSSSLETFDAIHASPPCQAHSILRRANPNKEYVDLIGPLRDLLQKIGKPYIIENVPNAH